MIARAFGSAPGWNGTAGTSGSRATATCTTNRALATILANDLRRSRSWGEQLSPIKYKIRGVVNGRTVVMRDRPRYSNADAAGNVEIDPTDPSRTEPADTVYRDRERYPNIMACAELVLENDQYHAVAPVVTRVRDRDARRTLRRHKRSPAREARRSSTPPPP